MKVKDTFNIWAIVISIAAALVIVPAVFFSYQFFTSDLSSVDNIFAGYIFYLGTSVVLYAIEFPFTFGIVHGLDGTQEANFRPYFVLAAVIFYLIFIVSKLFKRKTYL